MKKLLLIISLTLALSAESTFSRLIVFDKVQEQEMASYISKLQGIEAVKKGFEYLKNKCDNLNIISYCFFTYDIMSKSDDINASKQEQTKYFNKLAGLFEKPCLKNNSADHCFGIAALLSDEPDNILYEFKTAVSDKKAELARLSFEYYTKSCDLGNWEACEARLFKLNHNQREALMDRYCMVDNQVKFCRNLAYCFVSPKGDRDNLKLCVELDDDYPDPKKAIKYFRKAYELDRSFGPALAEELMFNNQCKEGKKLMTDLCDKADGEACFLLGWAYISGQCVKYDLNLSKKLFAKACDYGSQAGCNKYKYMTKGGY
ncbi:hypothetical protein [Campylobacter sp. 7477a]|uniref:hypothetical protein n=1 Tax=Campylobacter sp. 7477a TaxID=2735741 RepID=UPI003014E0D1|nr:sel1 repeat family protein [Campylobacter sp. 7477a]